MGGEVIRRQYYGWFDPRRGKLMLSLLPPDAPVRRAQMFESQQAVRNFIEHRSGKASVAWYPPLPVDVDDLLKA